MTDETLRKLVRRAAEEPGFLTRLITDPQSMHQDLTSYGISYVAGAVRPDDLLSLPVTARATCGDAPTCGVTCSHTCSGGYTMSCGGTCDYTCDYTASLSRSV